MRGKQEELIKLLRSQNNTWLSAEVIASSLNTTTRTIRNYVSSINKTSQIIMSSKKGYKLDKEINISKSLSNAENTPTAKQHLLSNLLIERSLNYYDFSDDYYYSVSYIEKLIGELNTQFDGYNLNLIKSNETLSIKGDELQIRRLIHDTLSEQTSNSLYFDFENSFYWQQVSSLTKDDVKTIEKIIISVLNDNNYEMNTFGIFNCVVHLAIAIDNSEYGSISMDFSDQPNIRSIKSLASEILARVNSELTINVSNKEVDYLTLILSTRVYEKNLAISQVLEYVDNRIFSLVTKILNEIGHKFLIEYNDERFAVNLVLHIQKLIERNTSNRPYSLENPFTQTLKYQTPLVYEMAVYVAHQIEKEFNITLAEDEIAFLALHIGSFESIYQSNLIRTALYIPKYNELDERLLSKLEIIYEGKLRVDMINVDYYEKQVFDQYDLIISTVVIDDYDSKIVNISPLLTDKDVEKIDRFINEYKYQKKGLNLLKNLNDSSVKIIFEKNVVLNSSTEYIEKMCDRLLEEGYITSSFKKSVLDREKLSSTVFCDEVAMPHALLEKAINPCYFIIVNDKPVLWNNIPIKMIILFAINMNPGSDYFEIFDNMIYKVSDDNIREKLLKCENLQEFLKVLEN